VRLHECHNKLLLLSAQYKLHRLTLLEVRFDELKTEESDRRTQLQALYDRIAQDRRNMADLLEPEWHDIVSDVR
jgi:hypothetical protein